MIRLDNMNISSYYHTEMSNSAGNENTRQIYASIREDLYIAAKGRATELRMPLRRFIEHALELALSGNPVSAHDESSLWNDEYLRMQAKQPLGSPVELTTEEAERVVKAAFGADAGARPVEGRSHPLRLER